MHGAGLPEREVGVMTTTETPEPRPDFARMYAERAHAEAERLAEEALCVIRECRYSYARDLLRGADNYLEALEHAVRAQLGETGG